MQKCKWIKLCSHLLLLLLVFPMMSFTVVIDAGHGGHDAGAIGKMGVQEKNLNLSVAKQLGAKIRENYPNVKVVLTRETDVFLPLQERANIANKNHADLFISIHTNAAENRNACGAEIPNFRLLGSEATASGSQVRLKGGINRQNSPPLPSLSTLP